MVTQMIKLLYSLDTWGGFLEAETCGGGGDLHFQE